MKMLQAVREHRPVDLVQEPCVDVHRAVGVDAEQIAVVGQVMDCAQREAVDHCCAAERVTVLDDVRRLEQRRLLERADRAAGAVGLQDGAAEAMLVKSIRRLARRVISSLTRPAGVVSASGSPTSSDAVRVIASIAVTNMGASGVYCPGAIPRKYTSGTLKRWASLSLKLSASAWASARGELLPASRKR